MHSMGRDSTHFVSIKDHESLILNYCGEQLQHYFPTDISYFIYTSDICREMWNIWKSKESRYIDTGNFNDNTNAKKVLIILTNNYLLSLKCKIIF